MSQRRIVLGAVLIVLLAGGIGYMTGIQGAGQAQKASEKNQAELTALKQQVAEAVQKSNTVQAELAALKAQIQYLPQLEPYMLEAIQRAGISDPGALLADSKQHPEVIPAGAVLGGTMQFTQLGLINERWVYGAYEDGHIAGAAVFQWEKQDSGIIWTPILVSEE